MCGAMYEPRVDGSNVTLIGIDFRDREKGPGKLERLLNGLKPDLIVHAFSERDFFEMAELMDRSYDELVQRGVNASKAEDALDNIIKLAVPFPIFVGNRYASGNNKEVGFALSPTAYRSRMLEAYSLSQNLINSSTQGKIDPEAMKAIDSALQSYYGQKMHEQHLQNIGSISIQKKDYGHNRCAIYWISS